VDQLRRLAEASPDDPLPRYALGLEHFQLEQYAEAIAAFEDALRVNGRYYAAYYHKARAEIRAGRHTAARATLDAGMELARAAGDAKTTREMKELRDTIA
jgi:tetratricopeptide (TPR) repeat protein